MGQKIYAQEDIKGWGGKAAKRGAVLLELPEGVSLQQLVTHATCGDIADHEPAKREGEKAAAKPVAAASKPNGAAAPELTK